jgi:hypothetical protein
MITISIIFKAAFAAGIVASFSRLQERATAKSKFKEAKNAAYYKNA